MSDDGNDISEKSVLSIDDTHTTEVIEKQEPISNSFLDEESVEGATALLKVTSDSEKKRFIDSKAEYDNQSKRRRSTVTVQPATSSKQKGAKNNNAQPKQKNDPKVLEKLKTSLNKRKLDAASSKDSSESANAKAYKKNLAPKLAAQPLPSAAQAIASIGNLTSGYSSLSNSLPGSGFNSGTTTALNSAGAGPAKKILLPQISRVTNVPFTGITSPRKTNLMSRGSFFGFFEALYSDMEASAVDSKRVEELVHTLHESLKDAQKNIDELKLRIFHLEKKGD